MEAFSPNSEIQNSLKTQKFKPFTLWVKKFNQNELSKVKLKSKLTDFFYSPDKYFDINSNIVINKKINFNNIKPLNKHSGDKSMYMRETLSQRYMSKMTQRDKHKLNNNNNNTKENIIMNNFETIDNEKIKKIFKNYKSKQVNNTLKKIRNIRSILNIFNKNKNKNKNNLPKDLSFDLDTQNRILLKKNYSDKLANHISKFIAKKVHKNEKELLMNSTHLYRFKKIILDNYKEGKNQESLKITDQDCLTKWVTSLRRPKNFLGKIESYINVSHDYNNPLWSLVVERLPITKETSVRSNCDLNNNKDFNVFVRKLKKIKLHGMNNDNVKNVENLDEINIKGKQLYNVEYDREMSTNCSKIIHNSFIDNGKTIQFKDVNDIFGYKTIYKNYKRYKNDKSYMHRSVDNII